MTIYLVWIFTFGIIGGLASGFLRRGTHLGTLIGVEVIVVRLASQMQSPLLGIGGRATNGLPALSRTHADAGRPSHSLDSDQSRRDGAHMS